MMDNKGEQMTDTLQEAMKIIPGEPRRSTLYDLTGHLAALYATVCQIAAEGEGEVPEDLMERLEATEEDIRSKLEGYGRVMKQLEADADIQLAVAQTYQQEADKYTARAGTMKRHVEDMKKRVFESLKIAGEKKIETEHFAFWRQASSPSVVVLVDDPAKLPVKFRRVTIDADKKALSEALKSKDEEAGKYGKLVQGEYLRWK